MNIKEIYFYADHLRLHGNLHSPDKITDNGVPVVIGSHGLLSDGESPKQIMLAEKLSEHGIAYFRFDHRGRGKSDGEFSRVTTFDGRISDMAAAISTITEQPEIGDGIGLFGSSMGGAVCIGISNRFNIKTLVTLAAPVRLDAIRIPADISKDPLFRNMRPEQLAFNLSKKLGQLSRILVFHGDADEVVSYTNALEIYEAAASPKKFHRFPGGDHTISDPVFQSQFIDETVKWFIFNLFDRNE